MGGLLFTWVSKDSFPTTALEDHTEGGYSYAIAGLDTWFQLSIQTVSLFTYTDSDTGSTSLGRQTTLFDCTDVPENGSQHRYNLSDPNMLCWTASDDTNAVGFDVKLDSNGNDTTYAILINEALTPSADIAY